MPLKAIGSLMNDRPNFHTKRLMKTSYSHFCSRKLPLRPLGDGSRIIGSNLGGGGGGGLKIETF